MERCGGGEGEERGRGIVRQTKCTPGSIHVVEKTATPRVCACVCVRACVLDTLCIVYMLLLSLRHCIFVLCQYCSVSLYAAVISCHHMSLFSLSLYATMLLTECRSCYVCSCKQMVNNRPIRIDLANSSDQDDSRGGSRRGGHFEERSDWRRADEDDGVWRKGYLSGWVRGVCGVCVHACVRGVCVACIGLPGRQSFRLIRSVPLIKGLSCPMWRYRACLLKHY